MMINILAMVAVMALVVALIGIRMAIINDEAELVIVEAYEIDDIDMDILEESI